MLALDVGSHCRFFDRLADYVDPKFYHSQEDREHINPKYMKRDERAAIKRAFKEQHKQNKRAKLDPDAIKTTTELQRQQAEKAASQEQQQHQAPAAVQQMGKLHLPASGSLSRNDLLKRLHAKMEVRPCSAQLHPVCCLAHWSSPPACPVISCIGCVTGWHVALLISRHMQAWMQRAKPHMC